LLESFVDNLARQLPFGYAFGAGMVTTVSPCAIAMLPAYISLYLGVKEGGLWAKSPWQRFGRALLLSAVVTLGFVVFFGIMGAILSLGGQFLVDVMPWVSVVIGVVLVLLGIYVTAGGHIYFNLPARLANYLNRSSGVGIRGFFIFGVAYGIAALGCTLPVFLVVVGSAVAGGAWGKGLLQFVSFALGMGFIIVIITVAVALFKEAVNRWLHRIIPVVARLSGLLLVFAGGYIIYFWFVQGDIIG
jgi:cytochrome c-type biogenesis protein